MFVGVPVKLGKYGVEEIIELKLGNEEQKALGNSAAAVRDVIEKLEDLGLV